ncbi:MAG TPA: hypothetical protein VJC16_02170 [Candidatus Nanoarchaeia archaeon]|nr:hypothetical protein [Candidatus Nanoarchaeia archaeon]
MSSELNIYYDDEGDFIKFNIGGYTEGHFKNIGGGVFERVDKKTNKITGIAIHGFRKRTKGLKDVKVSLPVKIELSASG